MFVHQNFSDVSSDCFVNSLSLVENQPVGLCNRYYEYYSRDADESLVSGWYHWCGWKKDNRVNLSWGHYPSVKMK